MFILQTFDFDKSYQLIFLIFSKIINPINSSIIAAENPILWLSVRKVIVLTNKGPKKDVSLPDVANKPNPLPWLPLFNKDVITTRLADCTGPINKPLIAARKKNVDLE